MNVPRIQQEHATSTRPQGPVLEPTRPSFTMAGFDGMVHLRLDVLHRVLQQQTSNIPPPIAVNAYVASPVSPEVDQRIADWIARLTVRGSTEMPPIGIEATLVAPKLVTLQGAPNDAAEFGSDPVAQVNWTAVFRLVVDPRNQGRRAGLDRHGLGSEGGEEGTPYSLVLGEGTVVTFASIQSRTQRNRFVFWGELVFVPTNLQPVRPADSAFRDLLSSPEYRRVLDRAIDSLCSGHGGIRVTPRFAFPMPQMPHRPEGTAPIDPVVVSLKATQTASADDEALAMGFNAPAVGPRGDASLISPLLVAHNYACCLSSEIVESIIRTGWENLVLPASFISQGPLQVPDPDNPGEIGFSGRALVRFTVEPAPPRVSLAPSVIEFQDDIRIVCTQEVQLLRLWDEDGTEIEDLDDLAMPVRAPFEWRLQLFSEGPQEESPGGLFLKRLASELLEGFYLPMATPAQLRNVAGAALASKGLVFLRANLR